MRETFAANIKKNALFSNADRLLLAVSGGLDSMVLCDLLLKLGCDISIAHCNFQLRGEEADADERLVSEFSRSNKLQFYSQQFDTRKYAAEKKISVQMAARELRYNWFSRLMQEEGFAYLLTAHHLNDNIETFFINLLRGSGINGLKGIEEKKGNAVRPLLGFTRAEIEAYARQYKIAYREDSSNSEDKYLRNYLRLHVIPKLKESNPAFEETFAAELKNLKQAHGIIQEYVEQARTEVTSVAEGVFRIDIDKLRQKKSSSMLLFELLRKYHFNSATVNKIEESLDAGSGKLFYSDTHELLRDRQYLLVRPIATTNREETVLIQKDVSVITAPVHLQLSHATEQAEYSENTVQLDSDKLVFPLRLEKWKQGDRFYPLGMKGSKKLSDFFTAEKMSLFDKENQWLLKSGEDIVWVIGRRIDDRYKITAQTKNYLTVELHR